MIGYLLWAIGGLFGAHRFYLRDAKSGAIIFVLGFTLVGLLITVPWLIVDAFLIPGLTRNVNGQIREGNGRLPTWVWT